MSRAQIERCSKLVSTLPVAEFITYVRRPPSFGREREAVHFKTFEDFAPALTGGGGREGERGGGGGTYRETQAG